METSLSNALTLMFIGMLTVFLVLSLVYLTGNLLIKAINNWLPETRPALDRPQSAIDPKVIAAISAGVEVFTGGKGRITKIDKQ